MENYFLKKRIKTFLIILLLILVNQPLLTVIAAGEPIKAVKENFLYKEAIAKITEKIKPESQLKNREEILNNGQIKNIEFGIPGQKIKYIFPIQFDFFNGVALITEDFNNEYLALFEEKESFNSVTNILIKKNYIKKPVLFNENFGFQYIDGIEVYKFNSGHFIKNSYLIKHENIGEFNAIEDLNNDGVEDLIFTKEGNIYLTQINNDSIKINQTLKIPSDDVIIKEIKVDKNTKDILAICENEKNIFIFKKLENSFTVSVINVENYIEDINLIDLDNDGKNEYLVKSNGELLVYKKNESDYEKRNIKIEEENTKIIDFDKDGKSDLLQYKNNETNFKLIFNVNENVDGLPSVFEINKSLNEVEITKNNSIAFINGNALSVIKHVDSNALPVNPSINNNSIEKDPTNISTTVGVIPIASVTPTPSTTFNLSTGKNTTIFTTIKNNPCGAKFCGPSQVCCNALTECCADATQCGAICGVSPSPSPYCISDSQCPACYRCETNTSSPAYGTCSIYDGCANNCPFCPAPNPTIPPVPNCGNKICAPAEVCCNALTECCADATQCGAICGVSPSPSPYCISDSQCPACYRCETNTSSPAYGTCSIYDGCANNCPFCPAPNPTIPPVPNCGNKICAPTEVCCNALTECCADATQCGAICGASPSPSPTLGPQCGSRFCGPSQVCCNPQTECCAELGQCSNVCGSGGYCNEESIFEGGQCCPNGKVCSDTQTCCGDKCCDGKCENGICVPGRYCCTGNGECKRDDLVDCTGKQTYDNEYKCLRNCGCNIQCQNLNKGYYYGSPTDSNLQCPSGQNIVKEGDCCCKKCDPLDLQCQCLIINSSTNPKTRVGNDIEQKLAAESYINKCCPFYKFNSLPGLGPNGSDLIINPQIEYQNQIISSNSSLKPCSIRNIFENPCINGETCIAGKCSQVACGITQYKPNEPAKITLSPCECNNLCDTTLHEVLHFLDFKLYGRLPSLCDLHKAHIVIAAQTLTACENLKKTDPTFASCGEDCSSPINELKDYCNSFCKTELIPSRINGQKITCNQYCDEVSCLPSVPNDAIINACNQLGISCTLSTPTPAPKCPPPNKSCIGYVNNTIEVCCAPNEACVKNNIGYPSCIGFCNVDSDCSQTGQTCQKFPNGKTVKKNGQNYSGFCKILPPGDCSGKGTNCSFQTSGQCSSTKPNAVTIPEGICCCESVCNPACRWDEKCENNKCLQPCNLTFSSCSTGYECVSGFCKPKPSPIPQCSIPGRTCIVSNEILGLCREGYFSESLTDTLGNQCCCEPIPQCSSLPNRECLDREQPSQCVGDYTDIVNLPSPSNALCCCKPLTPKSCDPPCKFNEICENQNCKTKPCGENAICPIGAVCIQNECTPKNCTEDKNCPVGFKCDLNTNKCKPKPCDENNICPVGFECKSGECKQKNCNEANPCPMGFKCEENKCQPQPCNKNLPCPAGLICQDNRCQPQECNAEKPCPLGQECKNNICQPKACNAEKPCPQGQKCKNALCEPKACDANNPCPEGQECKNNICQPKPCDANKPCPQGQACINGGCQPNACDENKPCPEGQECKNNICQQKPCDDANPCPQGQTCKNGLCESDPNCYGKGINCLFQSTGPCSDTKPNLTSTDGGVCCCEGSPTPSPQPSSTATPTPTPDCGSCKYSTSVSCPTEYPEVNSIQGDPGVCCCKCNEIANILISWGYAKLPNGITKRTADKIRQKYNLADVKQFAARIELLRGVTNDFYVTGGAPCSKNSQCGVGLVCKNKKCEVNDYGNPKIIDQLNKLKLNSKPSSYFNKTFTKLFGAHLSVSFPPSVSAFPDVREKFILATPLTGKPEVVIRNLKDEYEYARNTLIKKVALAEAVNQDFISSASRPENFKANGMKDFWHITDNFFSYSWTLLQTECGRFENLEKAVLELPTNKLYILYEEHLNLIQRHNDAIHEMNSQIEEITNKLVILDLALTIYNAEMKRDYCEEKREPNLIIFKAFAEKYGRSISISPYFVVKFQKAWTLLKHPGTDFIYSDNLFYQLMYAGNLDTQIITASGRAALRDHILKILQDPDLGRASLKKSAVLDLVHEDFAKSIIKVAERLHDTLPKHASVIIQGVQEGSEKSPGFTKFAKAVNDEYKSIQSINSFGPYTKQQTKGILQEYLNNFSETPTFLIYLKADDLGTSGDKFTETIKGLYYQIKVLDDYKSQFDDLTTYLSDPLNIRADTWSQYFKTEFPKALVSIAAATAAIFACGASGLVTAGLALMACSAVAGTAAGMFGNETAEVIEYAAGFDTGSRLGQAWRGKMFIDINGKAYTLNSFDEEKEYLLNFAVGCAVSFLALGAGKTSGKAFSRFARFNEEAAKKSNLKLTKFLTKDLRPAVQKAATSSNQLEKSLAKQFFHQFLEETSEELVIEQILGDLIDQYIDTSLNPRLRIVGNFLTAFVSAVGSSGVHVRAAPPRGGNTNQTTTGFYDQSKKAKLITSLNIQGFTVTEDSSTGKLTVKHNEAKPDGSHYEIILEPDIKGVNDISQITDLKEYKDAVTVTEPNVSSDIESPLSVGGVNIVVGQVPAEISASTTVIQTPDGRQINIVISQELADMLNSNNRRWQYIAKKKIREELAHAKEILVKISSSHCGDVQQAHYKAHRLLAELEIKNGIVDDFSNQIAEMKENIARGDFNKAVEIGKGVIEQTYGSGALASYDSTIDSDFAINNSATNKENGVIQQTSFDTLTEAEKNWKDLDLTFLQGKFNLSDAQLDGIYNTLNKQYETAKGKFNITEEQRTVIRDNVLKLYQLTNNGNLGALNGLSANYVKKFLLNPKGVSLPSGEVSILTQEEFNQVLEFSSDYITRMVNANSTNPTQDNSNFNNNIAKKDYIGYEKYKSSTDEHRQIADTVRGDVDKNALDLYVKKGDVTYFLDQRATHGEQARQDAITALHNAVYLRNDGVKGINDYLFNLLKNDNSDESTVQGLYGEVNAAKRIHDSPDFNVDSAPYTGPNNEDVDILAYGIDGTGYAIEKKNSINTFIDKNLSSGQPSIDKQLIKLAQLSKANGWNCVILTEIDEPLKPGYAAKLTAILAQLDAAVPNHGLRFFNFDINPNSEKFYP